MKFATFDCETIPAQSLPDTIKSEFADSIKVGNLGPEKAQEKIDKKMSLDPDLCEVVCFSTYTTPGWFSETSKEEIYSYDHNWGKTTNIITNAWKFISIGYLGHIPLVSFNGIQFDLPVLLHQAMRLNIPVSPQMYSDLTKKYDNRYHYDLMQILAGWDKSKWKPLDFYLKLFGIGEKTGDGSEVYGWWQAGDCDKIREHCEIDVRLTAKLFDRVKDWIVKEDRYGESPL